MTAAPARAADLDLFKTALVAGMVATHVAQLLGEGLPDWVWRFTDFINLVTFSGFLLAFGIGVGAGGNRAKPLAERLVPAGLLLLACWLSSLAFAMLVERTPPGIGLLVDVVTLRRLFGWSEFLASFFALYLLLAVARGLLVRIATDAVALGLAIALAIASTWIEMNQGWPATATIVGTRNFASFPLLAYLPWFLIGVRLGAAGGRVPAGWWLAALAATSAFALHLWQTGALPGRFPPTALWVMGAALPLAAYWAACRRIAQRTTPPWPVLLPGRYVLRFLVLSNLAIFAARHLWDRPVTAVWSWLAVSAALLLAIGAACALARWRPRERAAA